MKKQFNAIVVKVMNGKAVHVRELNPLGDEPNVSANSEIMNDWLSKEATLREFDVVDGDDVEKLAKLADESSGEAESHINFYEDERRRMFIEDYEQGFTAGYNAHAESHPFSLEDMRKAILKGINIGESTKPREETDEDYIDIIIKSIKPTYNIGDKITVEKIDEHTVKIVEA